MARRVESAPALVIASFRDDELDRAHPLRIVLGELATTRGVARIGLKPLSLGAVAELAEGCGVDAQEVFRRTGGNPFFVREVLDGAPAASNAGLCAMGAELGGRSPAHHRAQLLRKIGNR